MQVQEAPDQPERTLDASCPTCGAPAERGQLVCLECGSRIALAYKRPPSWRIPVAITVLVAALAVAGAVFAYNAIGDDAEDEVAAVPLKPKKATSAPKKQTAAEKPAAAGDGLVPKGELYTWPKDLRGYTVVLHSSEDRGTATSFARSAAESQDAKVGVIRADDFRTLPKGFFVVFRGSYKTRARADLAAARLGVTYSGAFAQRVTP